MLVDELQLLDCQQIDESGHLVDISASRMRDQANDQKLIECFRDSVRIELFVPVVPLQDEILRRAIHMPIGEREVPVTTAEDLILLKLAFHRVKDLQDVRGILWVQRGRLDLDYLRHWSACSHERPVQDELEQLMAEYPETDGDAVEAN